MSIDEIYEELKKETSIKSYKIETEKMEELTIFDSKFGGMPYWDFSKEFPTDNKGEKLNLLAQINFEKENFEDDGLPEKGILQFFISVNDDIYGMDFDHQDVQENWRVIFHDNVNYEITEDEIINNGIKTFKDVSPDYYVPFKDTYKIKFELVDDVINVENEEFDSIMQRILKEKFNIDVEENKVQSYLEQINDDYYEKFYKSGHKLFGYPSFTQSDPRNNKYGKYSKYDTLLLQIDSDDDIMWGDCGIANFFINKDDLKRKDFSNILYNWDCC